MNTPTIPTTCPCCGAVLPARTPVAWDAIIGVEHAKRAVEVALAGDFTITFVGVGLGNQALDLARWARAQGLVAYTTALCSCGNYGSADRGCTCTVGKVRAWQRRPTFMTACAAHIVVEMHAPGLDRMKAYREGKRGEPEDHVLRRVREARDRPLPQRSLDLAGERLILAATRQLDLTPAQIENMTDIAHVVARLASADRINAAHLAEALQYRNRYPLPPETLEPDVDAV